MNMYIDSRLRITGTIKIQFHSRVIFAFLLEVSFSLPPLCLFCRLRPIFGGGLLASFSSTTDSLVLFRDTEDTTPLAVFLRIATTVQ